MKKRITLLFLALFAGINFLHAQNWAGGIDEDKYNWGYSFQYISAEYKLWKSATWQQEFPDNNGQPVTRPLAAVFSRPKPGFAIGFVGNRKIDDHLDLRLTPTLVFSERELNYVYTPGFDQVTKKVQATMVDLPLSLKLKSDRLMNFRAYLLSGLKYSASITSAKKQNNVNVLNEEEKFVNNYKKFLSYEAGAGMDFYFSYFKMSTEIKISQSFKNILLHENTAFATPIEKAKLRHFTFSLFFE